MKIKTIKARLDNAAAFDKEVNQAVAEGYQLARRDVVPGFRLDGGSFLHNMLYAELVQLDPEPEAPTEAQPVDPIACLEALRKFCAGSKCEGCPLEDWCPVYLPRNEGPADWELPGEEAGL